jgi:5-formyltetrahydrofolate cyclo-ligase
VTARAEDAGQLRSPPGKPEWRARLTAARRALPAPVRTERAAALIAAAVRLATTTGGPVCAYVPVGTEPGAGPPAGSQLPDALHAAGLDVLLPVVPDRPGPLDWAYYGGADDLAAGPIGLREPAGARLGPAAIGRARLVLVPALAVDRRGIRIGRGAGYYDRSLPLATPGVPVVVLVHDEELVDELPAEPHDARMTGVLRAAYGLAPLPLAGNKI